MSTVTENIKKEEAVLFISCLIKAELDKLRTDIDEYYGSEASVENENYILKKAKELLNYDYEQDKQRDAYCLKATPIEIWEYWLVKILPQF